MCSNKTPSIALRILAGIGCCLVVLYIFGTAYNLLLMLGEFIFDYTSVIVLNESLVTVLSMGVATWIVSYIAYVFRDKEIEVRIVTALWLIAMGLSTTNVYFALGVAVLCIAIVFLVIYIIKSTNVNSRKTMATER